MSITSRSFNVAQQPIALAVGPCITWLQLEPFATGILVGPQPDLANPDTIPGGGYPIIAGQDYRFEMPDGVSLWGVSRPGEPPTRAYILFTTTTTP